MVICRYRYRYRKIERHIIMVYKTKTRNLFNVLLTDEQVNQLELLAHFHKVPKSVVLRNALAKAFEEMEQSTDDTHQTH